MPTDNGIGVDLKVDIHQRLSRHPEHAAGSVD
jgi:hypothetical protein